MARTKNWIAKMCALGLILSSCLLSAAAGQDTKIQIDRALNSPTLTIRYSGGPVAQVELRVNGASFGTRSTDPGSAKGETNFTLDLSALNYGNNEVEVRLYDKFGKLIGTQKSNVTADDASKSPVYLIMAKEGSTVQGPVHIAVGFGKSLRNTYVSFFIDNQFKAMTNTAPYSFTWDSTRDSNGWHDIEAWVVDDTSTTFKTKKNRLYVNNPGGNTVRKFEPAPAAPAPPVVPPVAVPPVAKIAVATAVAAPPAAVKSVPTANLQISPSAVKVGVASVTSGIKTMTPPRVGPVTSAAKAVVPQVTSFIPVQNAVRAVTGAMAGIKSATYGNVVATGPQMLMPTGKRVSIPEVPKTAVITAAPKAAPKTVPLPKTAPKLAPLPKVVPTVAAATAQTPLRLTNPATASIPKVAASSMLSIGHGSKLPNLGSYSILLNSKLVDFDWVQPRVQDGIPLTPFRHLFQQSGGKVDWENATKTVTANGHGKEIYIKIGDKLAKVNSLPIELDLAPFVEKGRTVVPLSFLKDTLDVEIDYDPVTGHVLITSIKKK